MFRSALFKLTAFYFGLLFFVCIAFSVPTFSIASERISRGAERQTEIFRDYDDPVPVKPGQPGRFDPDGELRRRVDDQVEDDRDELLQTIIMTNLAVLTLGTALCFLFAKRTLRPIEDFHKAQSRFTADASHELRTPLTVMKTEIEVALLQKLDAPKLREVLTSNLEEIDRLSALSDQLLSLTRVSEPKDAPTKVELSQLVEHEISTSEKKFSLTIDRDIEDNITIEGIESLLRDLINILISNAVQYAGDAEPVISVSLTRRDSHIELVVRDKGMGIDPNDLPHVFERFYRGAKALKKRRNGHGLGLSIAAEIVERHKGHISVTSQPGEYTEFTINF